MKQACYILTALLAVQGMEGSEFGASKNWIRHTIDNTSFGADGVRTADVNGDGLPDLATGWEQGGVSRIYLMQRDGVSIPTWIAVDAGSAPDVEDALLVDLDGDGALDVVSSTEGESHKVLVHWAPGPPADYTDRELWKTETLFEDGSRWMFSVTMDIDGKHGPDLVIGGKGKGASLGWLESPANPRDVKAWRYHPLTPVRWTMSIIRHDVDGDSLSDILVSDRKGKKEGVFWLKNPGTQQAALGKPWPKQWIAEDLSDPNFISVHDFDLDGQSEIIVSHKRGAAGGLTLLHPSGAERWSQRAIDLPAYIVKPKSAQAADINLDGRSDLILSCEAADENRSGIVWLQYVDSWEDSNWQVHDISGPEGVKFDLNLLLDVDGDGDADVLNTEENNNSQDGDAGLGLVWYENPSRCSKKCASR